MPRPQWLEAVTGEHAIVEPGPKDVKALEARIKVLDERIAALDSAEEEILRMITEDARHLAVRNVEAEMTASAEAHRAQQLELADLLAAAQIDQEHHQRMADEQLRLVDEARLKVATIDARLCKVEREAQAVLDEMRPRRNALEAEWAKARKRLVHDVELAREKREQLSTRRERVRQKIADIIED